MEGPQGSLIVFDASGYHQAGTITNGGERWVARFHVSSGPRNDGVAAAANPYARRNWDYRSGIYSTRENEAAAPWEPLPEKPNKEKIFTEKQPAHDGRQAVEATENQTRFETAEPVVATSASETSNAEASVIYHPDDMNEKRNRNAGEHHTGLITKIKQALRN
jgi:hypothetical protein